MRRSIHLVLAAAAVLTITDRAAAQGSPEARARAAAEAADAAAARGWVGLTFSTGTSGAVVVNDVFDDSPAGRAGIQEGDTIVLWNGSRDVAQAMRQSRLDPGETVKVRVRRRGERDRDLVLRAATRPRVMAMGRGTARRDGDHTIVITVPDEHEIRVLTDSLVVRVDSLHNRLRVLLADSLAKELRDLRVQIPRVRVEMDGLDRDLGPGGTLFGLGVAGRAVAGAEFSPMNPGLSSYFHTDKGLLVLRVTSGTPAARSGLQAGDVVVEANDAEVADIGDLRRAITRTNDSDHSVKLEILRKGKRRDVQLKW
jgi:S1-C subfamily serine protease